MHLTAPAIILSARAHGESGSVVRALTAAEGLRAGYVPGGQSRRLRPLLQPGNLVIGAWRARGDDRLATLTVEPLASRAALHGEPVAAAALDWLTALTAAVLPEAQPFPRLHDALDGVLRAIEAAHDWAGGARGWAGAVARYELLLLAELGFGLALDACVETGARADLAYVSPRSGAAVSRAAAAGFEARLLPLPAFLRAGGAADWPDVFAALAITGRFLERDVLTGRATLLLPARARLLDRLGRAAG